MVFADTLMEFPTDEMESNVENDGLSMKFCSILNYMQDLKKKLRST